MNRNLMLVLFLIIVFFSGCRKTPEGVKIIIKNESGTKIDNVVIKYRNNIANLKSINHSDKILYQLFCNGESDIIITFQDSLGNLHTGHVDTYIEPYFTGSLEITIDSRMKVAWVDNIIIGAG